MKTFVLAVIAIYKLSLMKVFSPSIFTICLLLSVSFFVSDSLRWFVPLLLNAFLIGKSTVSSDHKEARRISLKNVKGMRDTCRRSAIWSGFNLVRVIGTVNLAERSHIHVYKYKCRQSIIMHRDWVQKFTWCYENSSMNTWWRNDVDIRYHDSIRR